MAQARKARKRQKHKIIDLARARKDRDAVGAAEVARRFSQFQPQQPPSVESVSSMRERIEKMNQILFTGPGIGYSFRKDIDLLAASIETAEKIGREAKVFSSASIELAVAIFAGHWKCRRRASNLANKIKREQELSEARRNGPDAELRKAEYRYSFITALHENDDSRFLDVHMSILAHGLEAAKCSTLGEQEVLTPKGIATLAVTFYGEAVKAKDFGVAANAG